MRKRILVAVLLVTALLAGGCGKEKEVLREQEIQEEQTDSKEQESPKEQESSA